MREHALDGRLAFAALFGDDVQANETRRQLQEAKPDADRARRWLRRAGQSGMGRVVREELTKDAAALGEIFRTQAAELAARLPQ